MVSTNTAQHHEIDADRYKETQLQKLRNQTEDQVVSCYSRPPPLSEIGNERVQLQST